MKHKMNNIFVTFENCASIRLKVGTRILHTGDGTSLIREPQAQYLVSAETLTNYALEQSSNELQSKGQRDMTTTKVLVSFKLLITTRL